MERLFGVPLEVLAAIAAAGSAAILALLLALVARRRVLWRLGLRNLPRRPGYAALVMAGLALGTAVVASALFTGDTMTHTVRSLVADSLGRVDEVVVQTRVSAGLRDRRWLEALASGAPLTAGSGYFDAGIRERVLEDAVQPGGATAALVPAIVEQATLVDLSTQQLVPGTNVLALPVDQVALVGALVEPSGAPLTLDAAGPDGLYLNAEAAAQLGAREGDALQLRLGDRQVHATLAAVYATGDLGGARPTALLPLASMQVQLGREGQINQVLVINQGSRSDSVTRSREAARALRARLIDDATAERARASLAADDARRALDALIATQHGEALDRLERLRTALDAEDPAVARGVLREQLGDPDATLRLGAIAQRLPQGSERSSLFGALNANGGLRVLELKRAAQERADLFASILTSIFVVLGVFSIATGLMLVFLVFALLAAARRGELAVARALGARQRDLLAMLLIEGLGYAVGAAAIGVAGGLAISHLLVALLQGAMEPLGLTLRAHAEPRSAAFAFFGGLLLALATMAVAAWWTSRLNVAAALRDQAEPSGRVARWLAPLLAVALVGGGVSLLVGGTRLGQLLPLALGLSGIVLGAERGARWALHTPGVRHPAIPRALTLLASGLLIAIWFRPREVVTVLGLGRPPLVPELFPVAGVALAVAAVWGVSVNLGPLLAAALWLVRPFQQARLLGRLSAAYLGQQTFRAGLAMAMFALVVSSLAVSSVLLAGAHQAYGRPDDDDGGYDLRVQGDTQASPTPVAGVSAPLDARLQTDNGSDPLRDLRAALVHAVAARPDDFAAIGALRPQSGELIRLGGPTATWQPTTLSVLDDELLHTTTAHLSARAAGYAQETQVWAALAESPARAVVGAPLATALGLWPTASAGLLPGQAAPLPSASLWLRARDGGQALRLEVVGVLAPRSPLGDGVFLSESAATRGGLPLARQVTYFLRTRDGLAPERAVSALNVSFAERGLRASLVDPELRLTRAVQAPISYLLQGFMGLGLVTGVLAVGLLSARAALERRAQIGMLRAMGMRAGAVQLGLLLEASAVALVGAGIGLVAGTALATQVVRFLQRGHPEFPLIVPVDQLVIIAVLAWGASLLAAAAPAWRAGRVAPMEALRYE